MSKNDMAEKEWADLLAEHTRRFEDRMRELKEKGIASHLDGENHYKDIDDWFQEELKALKKKYDIK